MGKEYVRAEGICEYVYTQRENSFLIQRRKLQDETWELSCRTYFEILDASRNLLDRVETVITKAFAREPTTADILEFAGNEIVSEIARVKYEYSGYQT